MLYVISKLMVALLMTTPQLCIQQEKLATYKNRKFSIEYPGKWQMTNEKGILNFFPEENHGTITISSYTNIDFPLEETKNFIIDMYKVKGRLEDVKMTKRGELIEFYYECIDDKVKWVTKVVRRKSNLYLLTINSDENKWEADKSDFLKVINSFRLL